MRAFRLFYVIICVFFPATVIQAQSFDCDNGHRLYFFRDNGAYGTLSYIENYTTSPGIVDLCAMPTGNHNALAGNPADGYLYYLNSNVLTRLTQNCTATPVCSLAFSSLYGGFDLFGRYWTVDGSMLQAIDINTCTTVKGPFPINVSNITDLAFSPFDCYIYIGNQRFDTTGTVDPNFISTPFNLTRPYGGIAVGSDGNIYGLCSNNTGGATLSVIDLSNNTSSTAFNFNPGLPQLGGTDMANFPCYNLLPDFQFSESGCSPITVSFQNVTRGPSGTWTYDWDFGEPASGPSNFSNQENPVHAYSAPGTYQIRLIVSLTPGSYCLSSFYTDTLVRSVNISGTGLTASVAVQDVSCAGVNNGQATVNVLNGNAPFTFQWQPTGGNNATATGLTAGAYSVLVTDAGGCSTSLPFVISEPTAMQLSSVIQPTAVSCFGASDAQASVNIAGGTPPFSYLWSSGISSGNTVSGLSGGVQQLTITDAALCTLNTTFIVPEPLPLALIPSSTTPICPGDTLTITTAATGGTSPYLYLWSSGAVSPSIDVSPGTTTSYACTVTDNNGCTAMDNGISVTVYPLPSLSINNAQPVICAGDTISLFLTSGMTSYTWSPTSGLSSSISNNPLVFPDTTTTYSINAIDINGCTDSLRITIEVHSLNISTGSDTIICRGGTAILNVNGGLSNYSWTPVTGLDNPAAAVTNASPAINTTYTVVASDSNGCIDTATLTVSIDTFSLSLNPDTGFCTGGSVQLQASAGLVSYLWSPADGLSSTTTADPVASPEQTSTYTLLATNARGCSESSFVTVSIYDLPSADFTYTPENPIAGVQEVVFSDKSVAATEWLWDFGDGSSSTASKPSHIYSTEGKYNVSLTVKNNYQCSDSISRTLEAIADLAIWLPGGFSPNLDGLNDIYKAEAYNADFIDLTIYDRLGECIFKTENIEDGWDGNYSGIAAPEGSYVCVLRYTDAKGVLKTLSKHFSLIR